MPQEKPPSAPGFPAAPQLAPGVWVHAGQGAPPRLPCGGGGHALPGSTPSPGGPWLELTDWNRSPKAFYDALQKDPQIADAAEALEAAGRN